MKKLLFLGFAALFLLSLVMVTTPVSVSAINAPDGEGVIWVEPNFVDGSEVGVGNEFTVEVKINISETAGPPEYPGMFAFQYKLSWNDTLLTCTMADITVYIPSDVKPWFWSEGHFTAENTLLDEDGNTKNDTHSYAESALGESGGFNGTMTLARYNFTVASAPWPAVSCPLDLIDEGISDCPGDRITSTAYDGTYWIPEFPSALIIFLFVITTLAAAILGKKAWLRKRCIHRQSRT